MLKKFKDSYEERQWRAARALIFCAFEGTEMQDAQVALYHAYDSMESFGDEDAALGIVEILEKVAVSHAREYVERSQWGWDNAERHNVLLCLRHLREHGEIHEELAVKHRLYF